MKIDIETLKRTKGIGDKTLERVIEQHELDNAIDALESSYVPSLDYTLEQDINLWQGDCLELMNHIPDKSIDMVLCDLPYGTTACSWDEVIPLKPLWKHYDRIVKDNGAIVLFGSQPFSTKVISSNIDNFKYEIIWEKERPTNIFTMKKQIGKVHENIMVFYKEQPPYNPIMTKAVLPNNNHGNPSQAGGMNQIETHGNTVTKISDDYDHTVRYPRSVLQFSRGTRKGSFHPTQKPVALLEYLIETYTNEDMLVLDNTMGGGSTGVACKNLGRRFLGIELDKEYFEIAKGRIDEN